MVSLLELLESFTALSEFYGFERVLRLVIGLIQWNRPIGIILSECTFGHNYRNAEKHDFALQGAGSVLPMTM
jgi:hypothetical protein